jgi:hypothetical protein
MPRLPIDYAKTVIYKIVCNNLNITECYVGHTTDFVRRKQGHKNRCINEKGKKYNLKLYRIIRDNGCWDNYSMVEIEKYPCNDANEACAKEREWYEKLNSSLNTIFPQRSVEERYIANKDELAIKHKKYRIDNKDEIAIKKNIYAVENREKIAVHKKQYYDNNRAVILENVNKYMKENVNIMKERSKIYRENHKDEIKEKQSRRIICECGKEINLNHKFRHLKSNIHLKNLKT